MREDGTLRIGNRVSGDAPGVGPQFAGTSELDLRDERWPTGTFARAEQLIAGRRYREAISFCRQELAASPRCVTLRLWLARALLADGSGAAGVAQLEECLRIDPSAAEARALLVELGVEPPLPAAKPAQRPPSIAPLPPPPEAPRLRAVPPARATANPAAAAPRAAATAAPVTRAPVAPAARATAAPVTRATAAPVTRAPVAPAARATAAPVSQATVGPAARATAAPAARAPVASAARATAAPAARAEAAAPASRAAAPRPAARATVQLAQPAQPTPEPLPPPPQIIYQAPLAAVPASPRVVYSSPPLGAASLPPPAQPHAAGGAQAFALRALDTAPGEAPKLQPLLDPPKLELVRVAHDPPGKRRDRARSRGRGGFSSPFVEAPQPSRASARWERPLHIERRKPQPLLRLALVAVGIAGLLALWRLGREDAASLPTAAVAAASRPTPEPPVAKPEAPSPALDGVAGDIWIHPLAGPERRMPERDSRLFGAERVGDRPSECRGGHCGVDLAGAYGEPVYAVHDGVVDRVQRALNPDHGGRYVRLTHRNGTIATQYFHLSEIPRRIIEGAQVKAGEVVGFVGLTGVKHSEPHLHFTIEVQDPSGQQARYLDPEPLVALWPLRVSGKDERLRVSNDAPPGLARGFLRRRHRHHVAASAD